jgi:sec-independent protein translocase protein TatA
MKLDPMLAIFNLGGTELILILAVALLLFGGKKLPELAKGLGQGIREFKKATKAVTDEVQNAAEEKPARKFLTNSQSQPAQIVSQSPIDPKPDVSFCKVRDHEAEDSDEARNGPSKLSSNASKIVI